MAIPVNNARGILSSYNTDRFANLFAQSDARSILYEVGENAENFPPFSERLTDRITMSAYSILSAAISLAENDHREEAVKPMEEAATLLHNVYSHIVDRNAEKKFHMLIAAMAFYASGQYSKAFVSIKNVEPQNDLAKIIAAFLQRKPNKLINISNPYLLANLERFDDYDNICEHAVTVAVSRAMSLVLEYLAGGNAQYIDASQDVLDTALSISSAYQSPSLWWIVRLLKLMIRDNHDSSLWNQLPLYFPDNSALLERYIRLLLFGRYPVMELWRSQRQAIPIVLDQRKHGAIVNMRTSAGKTRVAELAMLQTLYNDSSAKILYLAPFRSLAFEIEQTLSQTFDWLGFHVSHLYGGFRINAVDKQLSQESSIIIATPEKARAILRGSPELFNEIKLIVMDEGHLIGANERYIKNELFLDHLRFISSSLNCKILMLSAVLPNPEHFSTWLTGDSNNVAKSDWKPSSERFGILRWRGDHVRIDWRGEFESFNPRFVESKLLGWGRRRTPFPNNKNEAVAATAVRLANIGPVMIFSARANSIVGLAESVLLALGQTPKNHPWPDTIWKAFTATCKEELPEDAIELKAAKYGVICHSNRLPTQVRIATERLMRSYPPKVIIASTTLGQGVNIGISSVIVASPYYNQNPINHRDFWNICGRAGRAFVDDEGKILYAIDETNEDWQIEKDHRLAEQYFNQDNSSPVESGLLFVINVIFKIAQQAGINFDQLLEMVAENDFSDLGENSNLCSGIIDLMDDSLLAFQEDVKVNPEQKNPDAWVDDVFRSSLAAIQSDSKTILVTQDQLFQIIKTRLKAIIRDCPDTSQRKAYVSTGLPLSSAKSVYRDKELFEQQTQTLIDSECLPQAVIGFLAWLEEWARHNATSVVEKLPPKEVLDLIRSDWIYGIPMRNILKATKDADDVCKDIYGYSIPWLINAIAQLLRISGDEIKAETLGNIGMLVEIGVPAMSAAMIFLAGIRSRAAATELSQTNIDLGSSINQVQRNLKNEDIINYLRQTVSESTNAWLNLHWETIEHVNTELPTFNRFRCTQISDQINDLIVRSHEGSTYLCSPDGRERLTVKSKDELPFNKVSNDYRFSFRRTEDIFDFFVRDPRLVSDNII
jgi:hypothetical protein